MTSSIEDIFSPISGLVNFMTLSERSYNDPEVFVVATSTANLEKYGMMKVVGNGSGAGMTIEDAKGAAFGEALERYSFSLQYPELIEFGSYRQLKKKGLNPVSPEEFPLFAPEQFKDVHFAPFEHDTLLGWVAGNNLITKEQRLVPASFVYMPYLPLRPDQGEVLIGHGVSTGAACAETIEKALLKGICEIVERDSMLIMWRNCLPCPEVLIDTESKIFKIFRDKFQSPGLEYHFFLTTQDIKIPSIFGVLINKRTNPHRITVAGAANLDPNVAIQKTLIELVQGLKWSNFVAATEFNPGPNFSNVKSFKDRMSLFAFNNMANHLGFLLDHGNTIKLSEIKFSIKEDDNANLNYCLHLLDAEGLEAIGLDITPSEGKEIGFNVTKVVIPGTEILESDFKFQYKGTRRWREVPVKTGFRTTPTKLSEINPIPHPYP